MIKKFEVDKPIGDTLVAMQHLMKFAFGHDSHIKTDAIIAYYPGFYLNDGGQYEIKIMVKKITRTKTSIALMYNSSFGKDHKNYNLLQKYYYYAEQLIPKMIDGIQEIKQAV